MSRYSACRLVRCGYGSRANTAPVRRVLESCTLAHRRLQRELSALAMMVRFRHSGTEGRWWQGRWLRSTILYHLLCTTPGT